MKNSRGWALFKESEAKSDFLDIEAMLDEAFVRRHLPFWITEEDEIARAIADTLAMDEEGKVLSVGVFLSKNGQNVNFIIEYLKNDCILFVN